MVFMIFTRDRDSGDTEPYRGVPRNIWTRVGKAQVYYASPEHQSLRNIRRLIIQVAPDVIYLNSLFNPKMTLQVLWLRRLKLIPEIPVVLAPRGELGAGALAHKAAKKKRFLGLAKIIQLYDGVVWQASTVYEQRDIRAVFGAAAKIRIAPILSADPADIGAGKADAGAPVRPAKSVGVLRAAYLSRIVPVKNLKAALEAMKHISGDVTFDVFGPIEDAAYWRECENLARRLPDNVKVNYRGPVAHENVTHTLAQYHVLILPTTGENFGHVIIEALASGCPVLISDRTPWRGLLEAGVGRDVPLNDESGWICAVQEFVNMDEDAIAKMSCAARRFAAEQRMDPIALEQNMRLFATPVDPAITSPRGAPPQHGALWNGDQ